MFKKILIANRGEIACRVIKTAHGLGIATIAVYSDADVNARHVRLATEAVRIGPAAARESYLDIERIVDAAKRSGARAVHPGYGFLSENAAFAEACEGAGIVFIGPPVAAIHAMGSKSAAKRLMERAGVPLTPGYHGEQQLPAFLAEQAQRIGYPVLIKASAGGGGKGMRRVDSAADFASALASCQREAMNAFGNDQVLIEKYIERPRHIEIQIFGDTHGNVVHLFERDCSVQRRHQKVLEEAPAPGMTSRRRAEMGQAALQAARAVNYVGAGTVEFIAAQDGTFYFMEMNTRLQVEHPVTEMITRLDLVEWQLRVAAGEALPATQEQLNIQGHAIEARIYAEDPETGFLPSSGRVLHLAQPPQSEYLRIDAGVEQGDEITPHYDPMIAKLIVWGENRVKALARLRQALASYEIVGVSNNVHFLHRLVTTPAFDRADLDTSLIERETAWLFPNEERVPDEVWLLAALAVLERESHTARQGATQIPTGVSPWDARDSWRLNGQAQRLLTFRIGDAQREINIEVLSRGYQLTLNKERVFASGTVDVNGRLQAQLGDRRVHATVVPIGEAWHVFLAGDSWTLLQVDPLHRGSVEEEVHGGLKAPMPGKVIALIAQPGARVSKGAPLLVMEAMKMEHTVCAPRDGIVKAFRFTPGEQVSDGSELVEFDALEAEGAVS